MTTWLNELCGGAFMPHGQCFLWDPKLISLHVVSDAFIALAYYSIPLTLVYFVRKSRDFAYPKILLMFAAFIVACGSTHLLDVLEIWQPVYWLSGGVKALTAAISVATAVALVRVVPAALALPSRREMVMLTEQLEDRVRQRTTELSDANQQLRREVAQREQAEAEVRRLNDELKHQVAELQALFDALPVGVAISRDRTCQEIKTNRTFATVLGIAPDANASLSAPPGVAPTTFTVFAGGRELAPEGLPMQVAVRENRAVLDFEETVKRSDGRETHISCNALPLRDDQGRSTGVVATFHDISARKAAEDELRLVIEAAPNGIIKTDARGTITLVNSQTLAMFGYTREELIGKPVTTLVPERLRPQHGPHVASFFATPSSRAMGAGRDLYGRRKDGSEVPIEIGLNPIRTPQGVIALAAIVDVTHRKQAERERLEFERRIAETQKLESIGVLAGGIAHDFNNLLTAILGNASLVRSRLPAEQTTLQKQLGDVELAAGRAAELCRQLLAYAGQGNFVIRNVQLDEVIQEQLPLLRLSASKLAELKLELGAAPRLIRADSSQLKQILMNLVINASEAIGDRPGTIVVRTRVAQVGAEQLAGLVAPHELSPGWFVLLEVEDNGVGMSSETVTRIFEPFFTTKFVGRGLGLATLIGIIRRHHGGIHVESKVGSGTRFRLLFPALEDSARPFPVEPESPRSQTRGRGTILVVDDESYVRDLARESLLDAGYDVVVAEDGEDGLRAVRHAPARYAAVLLDLSMPRLDGQSALLALRVIAPRLPVILTTGHGEQKISEQFLRSGLAGFLPKPFTPEQLTHVIADAIRRARQAT